MFSLLSIVCSMACTPESERKAESISGRSEESAPPAPVDSAPSEPPTTRTVTFEGGKATIVSQGNREHVTVVGPGGKTLSDSYCIRPYTDYDSTATLFAKVQKATLENDPEALAELIRFPLTVHGDFKKPIEDRDEFLKKFEAIFTSSVRQQIAKAKPKAVYCRGAYAMLGTGVVWAVGSDTDLLVEVVNP